MTDKQIKEFSADQISSNKNTEFYSELKNFVDNVENAEIVDFLESSKWIDYNRWSIIPILFPLCLYYKREKSTEWLVNNIDFSKVSSKDVLSANMLKLGLPINILPKSWETNENLLPLICEDLETSKEYIKKFPESIKGVMNDDHTDFHNSTLVFLEYLYENGQLDEYKTVLILSKFVNGNDNDNDNDNEYNKLKFIIDRRNPTIDDFFEAFYKICE